MLFFNNIIDFSLPFIYNNYKRNYKENGDTMDKKSKKNQRIYKKEKTPSNTVTPKRIRTCTMFFICLLIVLTVRIGFIQFVQGADLKEKAYKQQTVNKLISAKRGNILDSTGKVLATSAQVDTVSINPTKITGKTDEETKEKKEKLAKAFSEIFDLDYEETLEKVNSTSSIQTIAKKVEQDKIDELKAWMEENNISTGINIDEDTKRYYPYNNLAAYVIGFCDSENQGIYGIERSYNSYLTGTPGKVVTSTDVYNDEISDSDGEYIEAENGNNIVLTIDANIQAIAEKYLKEAVENNNARNGNVIIMKPSTGDILAMAQYPDYDLNTPFTPTSQYWIDRWDSLSSSDKTEMYRNIMVSSRYEPGSTFKLINASIALEEDITDTDIANDFNCIGYEMFGSTKIKCWTSGAHGHQTLRQVLENSCNPGMMQLVSRIGVRTLYKYYNAYGLFSKTNVGLPEEINSNFHKEENVGATELATMAFGQRIKVTPLQLITSISAIANDGVLMKPRIVKQIVNTDTNAVTNIQTEEIRQVISSETASKMLDMMESVVAEGTGSSGAVKGYSIGGKTGTSEPPAEDTDFGYVASFVAVAPAENPEIVILVALYDPQVKNYHGGTVAGPVVSNILSEVLPYLGITADN
jgi:stage V sporulation protein D (sporulation-specific penicillin-binding protein)